MIGDLYPIIKHALAKDKNLQVFIQPLHHYLIDTRSKSNELVLNDMTDQQILAQVYKNLKKPLKKIRKQIKILKLNDDDKESQKQQQIQMNQQQQYQQQDQGKYQQQVQFQQQPIQQEQNQQDNQQDQQEQLQQQYQDADDKLYQGQQDVGLYGQQLDQQNLQSYHNQLDQDPQFRRIDKQNQQQDQGQDNTIEDNFNQYRQIQLENQIIKNKQNPLNQQIQLLQKKAIQKKQWTLLGQIKARQRPLNSLLEQDLQYKSGVKFINAITQQINQDLQNIIKKRILDQLYDDRIRYIPSSAFRQHYGSLEQISTQKSKKGLAQLYQLQFQNYLGFGQNKNDKLKKQIMESFKQLNYKLDCLSNFNFIPKPSKSTKSTNPSDAIIVQQKVPLTLWNGQLQDTAKPFNSQQFRSEKQINNKSKRLKNKRISRQRKKQQIRKKNNKKIQYGGMTKYQLETKKKIIKNRNNSSANIKYNKSQSFFKSMNENGKSKPNPNINKMKI